MSNLDLESIRVAIVSEFGEPFDSLELRHKGTSEEVPVEIDVLFFEPGPTDNHPLDDWFTYLVTCGLATRALTGSLERVELLLSVRRRLTRDERQRLGRRLAELGTVPFRDRFELYPEMILSDVTLPLFERMTHVALSLYLGGEYLPTDPPIALLDVTPVFESEAEQMRVMSVFEGLRRFAVAGVKRDDPERKEVDLASIPALPVAPRKLDLSEVISMEEIWTELERKLGAEAGLHGPATEDSIQNLRDRISSGLPETYLASLRRHDGADNLDGFELLPVARVIEVRKDFLDQLHTGKFDDLSPRSDVIAGKRIDRVWWNAAWVPFAKAAKGRLLFLDLDPWQHGTAGQILEWDPNEGPIGITDDSFEAWLKARL
ncbi:MAG TPA: SMI1/KNR4 family protein [Pyrinomonadaceae bacterium]|nr:SMI1/KNR4 family protein [Pyrinomonadaceae bacterium]